jgi:hypothetical protein
MRKTLYIGVPGIVLTAFAAITGASGHRRRNGQHRR